MPLVLARTKAYSRNRNGVLHLLLQMTVVLYNVADLSSTPNQIVTAVGHIKSEQEFSC